MSCSKIGISFPNVITNRDIELGRKKLFSYIKNEEIGEKIAKCYIYKAINNRVINECIKVTKELKFLCFNDLSEVQYCKALLVLSNILGNSMMEERLKGIIKAEFTNKI